MKQPKDPAKEQQDIEDEEKMKEVKGAMQSKITIDDDDDEEISLEYIDEIMKKATARRSESKTDVHTLHSLKMRLTVTGTH